MEAIPGSGEAREGDSLSNEARRLEIRSQLVDPASTLTPDQKMELMEESDRLLESSITERLSETIRSAIDEHLEGSDRRMQNEIEAEVESRVTPLQAEINRLRTEATQREQQRLEREAVEKKNKTLRTIKLVAGAIGFAVAVTTPIGAGVIIAAGIGSVILNLGAKFGENKIASYVEKMTLKATEIARLRGALADEPANSPSRIIAESMISDSQEKISELDKKRRWVGNLTKAATYTSPVLSGFAIGATLGGITHAAFDSAVNSAVDARMAAPGSEAGGAATGNDTGGAMDTLGRSKAPVFDANPGDRLNLPGSAWDGTTTAHASGENMLNGGLDNPSNYNGSADGMAADKFATGVEATRAPNYDALFAGANGATTANAHQVLNLLKGDPSMTFTQAYESVMSQSLPSFGR